jgi:hypothetical protein
MLQGGNTGNTFHIIDRLHPAKSDHEAMVMSFLWTDNKLTLGIGSHLLPLPHLILYLMLKGGNHRNTLHVQYCNRESTQPKSGHEAMMTVFLSVR